MNKEEIIITNIDKVSEKIQSIWDELNVYDLNNLKEAWNDEVCDEFISKIKNTDTTIVKIQTQLELLKECWKKKIEEVNTQEVNE